MENCKGCENNFNTNDMIEGYCKVCTTDEIFRKESERNRFNTQKANNSKVVEKINKTKSPYTKAEIFDEISEKIVKVSKLDKAFNKARAYENLRKFKMKMIILIQLLSSSLIYYFSNDFILVIISIISIELVILIMNKKPTKNDFKKATEEMNNLRK